MKWHIFYTLGTVMDNLQYGADADNGDIYWGDDWFLPHRAFGPAYISVAGTIHYVEGNDRELSRKVGPAVIYSTGQVAFRNTQGRHRTDGPAYISEGGRKEYWINGQKLSELEYFLKYGVV